MTNVQHGQVSKDWFDQSEKTLNNHIHNNTTILLLFLSVSSYFIDAANSGFLLANGDQ